MSISPEPEVNAYAPPQTDTALPASALPSLTGRDAPTSVRIAGWLMIANAVLILVSHFFLPVSAAMWFVPAILDLVIGATLARGSGQLRIWAMIRCVGGAVFAAGPALMHGNHLDAVLVVAGCASLLGLLMGRAGTARIAVCTSIFGLCLLLNLIGVIGMIFTTSILR